LPGVEQLRTLALIYHVPVQHLYALMDGGAEGWDGDTGDFLSLRARAALLRRMDQPGPYLACLLCCEERAEEIRDFAWVRRARAQALVEQGLREEAGQLLLDLLCLEGVPEEEHSSIWLEVCEVFEGLGNLEVGEASARRGLARLHPQDGWTRNRLEACLGRLLVLLARRDGVTRRAREATRLLQRALDGFEDQGLARLAGPVRVDLGRAHLAVGERVLGMENLRRALVTCRESGSSADLALAHMAMGEALAQGGRHREARGHLMRAEGLAAAAGVQELQFRCLVHLSEAEEASGMDASPTCRRARSLLPWLRSRTPERERFESRLRCEEDAPLYPAASSRPWMSARLTGSSGRSSGCH
jgi:tetratricopeptide (TPR) repeat protein